LGMLIKLLQEKQEILDTVDKAPDAN